MERTTRKRSDYGDIAEWKSVRRRRRRSRLFGSDLSNVYGRDLTGCFLNELTPHDLWTVVTEHYRAVVRTGEPLFAPISVSNRRWYNEVSRLLLPLSCNYQVHFVMGADYKRILQ